MAGQRLRPTFRPDHFRRTGFVVAPLAALVIFSIPAIFGFDAFGMVMWVSLGVVHTVAWIPAAVMHRCAWWRSVLLAIPSLGFIYWGMFVGMFTAIVGPLCIGSLWALVAAILLRSPTLGLYLFGTTILATIAWFIDYTRFMTAVFGFDDIGLALSAMVWHATAAFSFYYAFGVETKDRRLNAIHTCARCEYSLVGLTTNTCPECGEPISPPSSPPSAPASAP